MYDVARVGVCVRLQIVVLGPLDAVDSARLFARRAPHRLRPDEVRGPGCLFRSLCTHYPADIHVCTRVCVRGCVCVCIQVGAHHPSAMLACLAAHPAVVRLQGNTRLLVLAALCLTDDRTLSDLVQLPLS